MFHHQGKNTHTYALIGITSWTDTNTGGSKPRALKSGENVKITGQDGLTPVDATILANTNINSPTILFSHSGALVEGNFDHKVLTITASNSPYIFTVGNASTEGVSLINAQGRFIAEFTIVSKD